MNLPANSTEILQSARAAFNRLDADYVAFIEALYLVYEQQAYKSIGYDTFNEYVDREFSSRLRSTQEYLRLGRAYRDTPALKELEFSKARLLVGKVEKEAANDTVSWAKTHTVQEVRERFGPATKPALYRLAVSFTDPDDARLVQETMDLGRKVVGSDSLHSVIVAMC